VHDSNEEYKYDDLKLGDCIGIGRHGPVLLVNKDLQHESVLRVYIKSELKQLPTHLFVYNHPFLVKTLYIFHDKNKILYLSDRIHGMHFLEFLQKRRPEIEEKIEEVVKYYMAEFITVLEYFEVHGYVERSFKPDNVMINLEGNLCFTSFYECEENLTTFAHSDHLYLPPEINGLSESLNDTSNGNSEDTLANLYKNDRRVMYWTLGVYMFICITGKHPIKKSKKVKFPSNLSDNCRNLLEQLLERDVDKRLCHIAELKKHPFFNGTDWESLLNEEMKPPLRPTIQEIESFHNKIKLKFNSEADTGDHDDNILHTLTTSVIAPDAHSGLSGVSLNVNLAKSQNELNL